MPTLKDFLFLSGDLFLPKSVRTVLEEYHLGNARSLFYVTNWSLLHIVSGLLVGHILLTYYPTYDYYTTGFWIHTVWELWQILVKNTPYWTLRGKIDVVVDTLLFMGGMAFVDSLNI
jgi:hypothetical protein